MDELKSKIHDEDTDIDNILVGNYYIPAIELLEDDDRPIGKWKRIHRVYLEETPPLLRSHLISTDRLHSYLANLDGQAKKRCRELIQQMLTSEGMTEHLKQRSQWAWGKTMNSIVSRAEEIIRHEMIYR